MSSNGRVGGTIGGSFSISRNSGPRSGSVGSMSAKDRIDAINAKRKEIEDRKKAEADALNALTSIEDTLVETQDVIKTSFNSMTPVQEMTNMLRQRQPAADSGPGRCRRWCRYLRPCRMGDLSGRIEGDSISSFSRGSPQRLQRSPGPQRYCTYSPDEAVIPLPNGRAVTCHVPK
jgi:hypothetical protein